MIRAYASWPRSSTTSISRTINSTGLRRRDSTPSCVVSPHCSEMTANCSETRAPCSTACMRCCMTAQARAQVRLIVTANKPNITPANAGEQPRGSAPDEAQQLPAWREVFLYFLLLGFINVGGPVAQLTMMFNHMVERRKWLSNDRFVHVMGFCHMLPGPEALQLAIYVGYLKRRFTGGILAGLTFIIPGAVVMIVSPA